MFELKIERKHHELIETPHWEVSRLLITVADKIRTEGITDGILRDINGNTVGSWYLDLDEEEDK